MYGINPNNPSDLLVEYLIKANSIGVKSLLMSYGILGDTQAKQIMGLNQLIASGDENTIFKIIALDPNFELHEEAFKRKYKSSLSSENKESLTKTSIQETQTENKLKGIFSNNNISIIELLLFLLCAYVLVKIIKS